MKSRAFGFALVIAIFAVLMVQTYISDKESEIVKQYGIQGTVVVAKVDINELELIDDSKVVIQSMPNNFLAPGHFKTIKEIENTIATVPILKGEQITKPRVTYPGAKTGLARQVSLGKRALAINVSEKHAVARLIKPGDRVDILTSIDISDGTRKDLQSTKTILQDVLILSTGQSMTNSIPIIGVQTPSVIKKMNLSTYSNYNTVTLELDPFQVQKLVYLLSFSPRPLFLSLRNNQDTKIERINSTRIFSILNEDADEAKAFLQEKYKKK